MLVELHPYTEEAQYGRVYNFAWADHTILPRLEGKVWLTAQAKAWITPFEWPRVGKIFDVRLVDVLPPATKPTEYRQPVFISEARYDAFDRGKGFYPRALIELLYDEFAPEDSMSVEESIFVTGEKRGNICLLENQKVALIDWLPAYSLWQLHVTEDWPYQVSPGTRIFALH